MHNCVSKMHRVSSVIRNYLFPQARTGVTTRYVVNPDSDKDNDNKDFNVLGANVDGSSLKRSSSWPNHNEDNQRKDDGKHTKKVEESENSHYLESAFAGSCTLVAGHTLVELTRQHLNEQNQRNGYAKSRDALINHILPSAYSKPIFVKHMVDPSKGYKPKNIATATTAEATCQTDLPITLSLNSMKEAERITAEAVQTCERDLQNWKGVEFLRKGLFPEAFEQLRSSARSNPKAMFNLGQCYFKGQGTVTNINKAVELWKQAAELGHPKANYQLALCHLKGIAVPNDKQAASTYMQRAVDAHVPEAQFWLGSRYLQEGLIQEGLSLIDKADQAGFKPAQKLSKKLKLDTVLAETANVAKSGFGSVERLNASV